MRLPPNAHTDDPRTSHIALAGHEDSGAGEVNREIVMRAIETHPGLTSAELVPFLPFDVIEARRRISDLLRMHRIVRGQRRPCECEPPAPGCRTSQHPYWAVPSNEQARFW